MRSEPFAPPATSNPLAQQSPPTLETLLAFHAAERANQNDASASSDVVLDDVPISARVLLALSDPASEAQMVSWAQRVLNGQSPQTIHVDDALEALPTTQAHCVLVEFTPDTVDRAGQLMSRLQAEYPDLPRAAVCRSLHTGCMLAALRAGAHEFIDVDSSLEASQSALRALLRRLDEQPSTARHGNTHRRLAPVVAIVAARAGLGCSVLATHLAHQLHTTLMAGSAAASDDLGCLLVEIGGSGGDCAIYLNTPGEFSLADAVAQQNRLDHRMIQAAVAQHESGLRMLWQTRQTPLLTRGAVRSLMARLRQHFKHVVLDVGANASPEWLAETLPDADEIWVLCDQNVVSVVWTMALLSQLEALGVPRERLRLIVNHHDPRLAMDAQQIATRLQLPLAATLPEHRRELANAVNHGKLLCAGRKGDPYAQGIDKLVQHLLQTTHTGLPQPRPATQSALAQLLERLRLA